MLWCVLQEGELDWKLLVIATSDPLGAFPFSIPIP